MTSVGWNSVHANKRVLSREKQLAVIRCEYSSLNIHTHIHTHSRCMSRLWLFCDGPSSYFVWEARAHSEQRAATCTASILLGAFLPIIISFQSYNLCLMMKLSHHYVSVIVDLKHVWQLMQPGFVVTTETLKSCLGLIQEQMMWV